MNRIYRLVWNKKLNIWTVASETARGATKKRNVSSLGSSKTTDQQSQNHSVFFAIKLLTAAISIVFISSNTFAETNTGGGSANNGSSMAISPTASQCGNASNEAKVDGPGGVAIGCGSAISGVDVNFQQALFNRRGTQVNNYPNGPRSYSGSAVALGRNNISTNPGGSTLIGNSNVSVGNSVFHNMAVGQGNRVGGTGYNQAIGVGNDIVNGTSSTAIGVNNRASGNTSIAMGRMSWADADQSIALGNTATVDSAATSGIAVGHSATTKGVRGIAIGSSTTTTQNYTPDTAANAEGTDSLAIGTGAKGTADQTTAVGRQAQATNTNAAAYGNEAQALGLSSVAVGDKSSATAEKSLALGASAVASDTGAIALGDTANAQATRSVALGSNAVASSRYVIAIGSDAKGIGSSSVAIGRASNAANDDSIAIGRSSTTESANPNLINAQSIAIGARTSATGDQSVALGADTIASGDSSVAIGGDDINRLARDPTLSAEYTRITGGVLKEKSYIGTEARHGSVAVGVQSVATGNFSSALGLASKATGAASSAFGVQSNAEGQGAVAFGAVAQATGNNSAAIGVNATASADDTTAIGSGETKDNSARALASGATAIGHRALASGESSSAIGLGAQATAVNTTAIGVESQAQSDNDIAIGRGAVTAEGSGGNNIAIGNGVTTGDTGWNVAMGSDGTTANSRTADGGAVSIGRGQKAAGDGAVAIGDPNSANGDGAVALGRNNTAAGDTAANKAADGAVAIGNENQAIGQGSVAIGNKSKTTEAGSIALGDTADAKAVRGVALGSSAVATNADDVALGAGSKTTTATGAAYRTGTAASSSVVSVGSAGYERRIQNVSAGAADTDAVNVSQLRSVQDGVDELGKSTAEGLGGGSTYDPSTGAVSNPTYNVNGKDVNNVGDAITELDKGWNLQSNGANTGAIKAGDTVDIGTADGEENLQVTKEGNDIKYSLNRDLKVNSVTAGDTVINNDGMSIANGPSVTKSGIDVAGNKISNVAAGTEGTDAVNKDQLDKASAASKTEVTEGKNITVTKTTGDNGQDIYNVATADDVEFNNVKVGDVSIDGTTGKISGVTAGDINPNSTDAINGSQLANNAQSVADALGGGSTVNPDGTVSKPTYNINGTDTNNVGDALAELDKGWTLQSNGANAAAVRAGDTVDIGTADGEENLKVTKEGNDIKYSLNRDLKVNSVTAGDTVINNDGLSIANGPSVTKSGIDVAGNKISNVAAGTEGTDAVNKDQLDKASAAAKTEVTEGKNITVTKTTGDDGQDIYNVATSDDVEFDSVKVGNVSIDGTTGKISGVTAGDVNPNSTDAINGSQLANNAQSVADALGGGSTVNPDGTVSKPTYNINGTDTNNVGDALAELDKGWTLQSNGANAAAVRAGDTVDIGTADGEENLQVTKEGNDIKYSLNRDLKVNSVTAGNTRLDNTGVEVKDAVGNSTTIVAGGTVVKDAQGNSTATTATGTTIKNAQGDRTILNGTGLVFTNASDVPVGPSVSRTGIDAGKEKISNVADGEVAAGSKDAVNGGQLNDSVGSVGDIIGGGVTNEGGKLNGPFTVNDKGYDNIADAIAGESAAAKTEVTEGKNINVTKTTGDDGQDIYNVATADDVEFDSVKVGNVSIDGTTGKISGVTAGDVNPNSTDAINGSQLYGVADSVKNAIGGKTVLNPDGSVTTSNVGNTGQNNIHDAIDSVRGQAIAAKTTVKEGENIVVTESKNADGSTNYEVATAKDVKFDSVTATDDEGNETVLNATGTQVKDGEGNEAEYGAKGISLKDQEGKGTLINQEGMSFIDAAGNNIGPSITAGGINAGNTVIRGVAAGRVAADSQEAINGSQLHAQGQGVQNIIGGNTQYDPNTGKYTNADIGGTGKDNINDAIGAVGKAAQEAKTTVTEGKNIVVKEGKNADGSTNYEVSTADDLDVNSLTAGGTKIDGNGLTIEGGPSVTKDGINAGDKKVTGVADGAIAAGSKDAVNGGQLHAQGQGVQNIIGGNTQYDPNTGKYTNADIGGTGKDNINDAIGAVGKAAQAAKSTVSNKDRNIIVKETSKEDGSRDYEVGLAKDISVDSVTAKDVNANQVNVAGDKGTTNITGGGISVTGPKGEAGPSMTTGGINAGDKKVTGVADGAVHSSSKDAINGSQLHQSYQNVGAALGGGAGYDPEKGWQAPSYNVAGSNYNNVGDALGAIDNRVTNLGDQLQQAFYDTNKRMDKLEDKMSAGIAATAALENAPFVPGKLTMAAGAAYYNDQSAIGVTFRRTADNGRWSLTTGAAMGSQGNSPLVRVGVSTVID